ncbi:MAG: hypothetical protein JXR69_08570 [Candidatus Delongbacteria bacterium]|nr:hypothetical protein [Candidatus Delongbacteria bacterium]
MNNEQKLKEFWENRNNFKPLIAKSRAWSLDSFAKDKRRVGLIYKIKDPLFTDKLTKINDKLSIFDCYNPFPKEYFHVTIKILGAISNEEDPSDYTLNEIDDILLNLKTKLTWIKNFKANVKMLNLFPSVLFAQIEDDGNLEELNRIICETNNIVTYPERDLENYIPHIALGNFKNDNVGDFVKAVKKIRNMNFGSINVDLINLVKVDITTPVPEFETLEKIKLGE